VSYVIHNRWENKFMHWIIPDIVEKTKYKISIVIEVNCSQVSKQLLYKIYYLNKLQKWFQRTSHIISSLLRLYTYQESGILKRNDICTHCKNEQYININDFRGYIYGYLKHSHPSFSLIISICMFLFSYNIPFHVIYLFITKNDRIKYN